jgi:ferrous iron transport protein B
MRVALAGNPNSGKSSLFNALTGLKQKTGNFPGVTVDKHTGTAKLADGTRVDLIDLPGLYSLTATSPDEFVATSILTDPAHADHPDAVVIVIDASNLKRNLYLATQILDLRIPAVLALNMRDTAEAGGISVDVGVLEDMLGVPVVAIHAKEGLGLEELLARLPDAGLPPEPFSPFGDIAERYRRIGRILPTVQAVVERKQGPLAFTRAFDRYATHPIWGYAMFLLTFFLIFQAVFTLAAYPMDAIESVMGWIGEHLRAVAPDQMWMSFIVDGVLAGITGVVVFVPQILILFACIAVLEESGYMARVSFLNDRLLRSVGMNGRSVVPLVSGFACAVPAIMATRTIENPKERLITLMVTPLMSCSARLPVYIYLVGYLVPDTHLWGVISLQGLFFLGLYLLGVVLSAAVAWVFNKVLKDPTSGSFFLELPIYRGPRWRNVALGSWSKAMTFVSEAGRVILVITLILWGLGSFGPSGDLSEFEDGQKLEASFAGALGRFIEPVLEPIGIDWKTGIAVITSFAAREVFVGTMNVLYGLDGMNLKPDYSAASAASLLIFYVIAMQCMSTLAIVKRETNGWRWPIVMFTYLTTLAYIASWITYRLVGP